VTLFILHASTTLYASGSPESSASDGSPDIDGPSFTGLIDNTSAPSNGFTESNNTGSAQWEDLVNVILTRHNRERDEVGVPPLTWNENLAADESKLNNLIILHIVLLVTYIYLQ
jgi:uncharacterized protein YkwD